MTAVVIRLKNILLENISLLLPLIESKELRMVAVEFRNESKAQRLVQRKRRTTGSEDRPVVFEGEATIRQVSSDSQGLLSYY